MAEEPCNECMNAGELADGTWICLAFSQHLADGTLYIQLVDESIDWEKCDKYWTPSDEGEDEDEDEDG